MKILKKIIIVIVVIVAILLVIPIILPSEYHVERSTNIEKSTTLCFNTAVDFNQRAKWDPWLEQDPDAKVNVHIAPTGVGSSYSWDGEIIGSGSMTINELEVNKRIKSLLKFTAPREMTSDVIWNFEEIENGTKIIWAFEGKLKYIERWFGLFMDKSIGPDFEKGLNNFKSLVESIEEIIAKTGEISIVNLEKQYFIVEKRIVAMDEISTAMGEIFHSLSTYINSNNIEIAGSPVSIHYGWDEQGNLEFESGFPVKNKISVAEPYTIKEIKATKAIKAVHWGPYDKLQITYKAVQDYLTDKELESNSFPWETYINNPMEETDPNKLETHVFQPIK